MTHKLNDLKNDASGLVDAAHEDGYIDKDKIGEAIDFF